MKTHLLHILQFFAKSIPFQSLVTLSKQLQFSPFYHAIGNPEAMPHIRNLYRSRTAREFEKDLDFLLKHFQPIGLEDLLKSAQHQENIASNCFFLSFDDGLREVHDIAAPILKKKGIPATIFLNADFVDNRDLFFRYKASLIIDCLKKNKYSSAKKEALQQLLMLPALSNDKTLFQKILSIEYADRQILDSAAALLDIDFDDFLKKQQPYLTSAQIQSLQLDGFTIGGHSADHPLYSKISLKEQLLQTQKSVHFVKANFDLPYGAFAFPFTDHGVSKSFFEKAQQENIFDISFGTAGLKAMEFPFHFQRFPMEGKNWSAEDLIKTEYLYFLIKRMFGKHLIKR